MGYSTSGNCSSILNNTDQDNSALRPALLEVVGNISVKRKCKMFSKTDIFVDLSVTQILRSGGHLFRVLFSFVVSIVSSPIKIV